MDNNIRTDYPFPENLVSAIFGGSEVGVLNADQLKGIKYVLSNLGERDRTVILRRFRDSYTQEEIGKQLQISKGRVGQIEAATLRKLRHPSRGRYIRDGYSIASGEFEKALSLKYEELEDERKRRLMVLSDIVYKLERHLQVIKSLCGDKFELIMSEIQNINREMPKLNDFENIHEMYRRGEMTVRIYNCIWRHFSDKLKFGHDEIEKLTLADVAQLTRSEAMAIRNLGAKSFTELEKIMYAHGLQFMPEEYF